MKRLASPFLILCTAVLTACGCATTGADRARGFNEYAARESAGADRILETLSIRPGQNIADLGAGGGYFSYRFARATGEKGRVYAIDIDPEFLEFIRQGSVALNLDNIEVLEATSSDPGLQPECCDLIFLRDVYHHLEDRVQYFRNLRKYLKEGGRIAIIDYRTEGLVGLIMMSHSTSPEQIQQEMVQAGYRVLDEHEFLDHQSFLIFGLK